MIAANGDRIGTVEEVHGEEVWVDPDAEIVHDIKEHTGWDVTDRNDAVSIQPEMIVEVAAKAVRLADELPEV